MKVVKVGVNTKVREALALSTGEKARIEAGMVTEKIREISPLTTVGFPYKKKYYANTFVMSKFLGNLRK